MTSVDMKTRSLMVDRRREFQERKCVHCEAQLFHPESRIICDYMLTDRVWKSCGFKVNDVACLRCAEERLGRSLVTEDFMLTVINRTLLWCIAKGYTPWLDDR